MQQLRPREKEGEEEEMGEAEEGDREDWGMMRGQRKGKGKKWCKKRGMKRRVCCTVHCTNDAFPIWNSLSGGPTSIPSTCLVLSENVWALLQEGKKKAQKKNEGTFFAYWIMTITTDSRQLQLPPPKRNRQPSHLLSNTAGMSDEVWFSNKWRKRGRIVLC